MLAKKQQKQVVFSGVLQLIFKKLSNIGKLKNITTLMKKVLQSLNSSAYWCEVA